ncbi:MAG: thioredoxin domain-containing protein [Novosphingobium sp.]
MNRPPFRRIALTLALAPLALGLAACSKGGDGGEAASAEPIAKVAPPEGKNWAEVVATTPEGGYLMGNPEAPIKLLEFGALSCSHCAEFSEKGAAELRDNFVASGRVSYELRLFMLNALDMPAVLLVTCGAPETVPGLAEQFWAWQPNMFQNLQAAGDAKVQAISAQKPPASFVSLAQASGMDQFITSRGIAADKATACLTDTKRATELARQTQEGGAKYEITGTPTFFINGTRSEHNAWPELKAELERRGAR